MDTLKLTDAEIETAFKVWPLSPDVQDRSIADAATAKAAWWALDLWQASLSATEPWKDSPPGAAYIEAMRYIHDAGLPRPEEVAG